MTDARDIYSRPATIDIDTLANLGPLAPLAGVCKGIGGVDVNPGAEGARTAAFEETIELQPIDPQTNGPQLFYGLRYVSHMTKPGEIGTYHGQVGYWLWEPETGKVIHSFTIPRGQVVLAEGSTTASATMFQVTSRRGTTEAGICSTGFLEKAFRTDAFDMTITVNKDGTWTYFQDTIMQIAGQAEPFHHTDKNTLTKVAAATPNPLMQG